MGETNISLLHFTVLSLLLLDVDHGTLLGISCEDVGLPNILVMAREMVSDSSNTWKHENKCCRTVSLSMITYISSSSRQAWEERQEKWRKFTLGNQAIGHHANDVEPLPVVSFRRHDRCKAKRL